MGTVAAVSVVVALTLGALAPRTATSAGCVSNTERRQVVEGVKRSTTHNVFGTSGTITVNTIRLSRKWQRRVYDRCGTPETTGAAGGLFVWFEKKGKTWRVAEKGWYYPQIIADGPP